MEDPNDPLFHGEGPRSVRLHVGGLGSSVISSDLVRTFSPFGTVSSVDIVRTKGRNFAYINLDAPSPQAVKRLFSLYNGCTWKGGHLKLETAKEFYLDKLRREWEERDNLDVKEQTVMKPSASLSSQSIESKEPQILSIYFPKLRKVKKIPMKGLGKHKRSFERVEALSCSNLQLCDCSGDCQATSILQGARKTGIIVKDIDKDQQVSELQAERNVESKKEPQTMVIGQKEKGKPLGMKLKSSKQEKLIIFSDDEFQTNIIDNSEKSPDPQPKTKLKSSQQEKLINVSDDELQMNIIDNSEKSLDPQPKRKLKSSQQEKWINVSDDEFQTNIIDNSVKSLDPQPKRKLKSLQREKLINVLDDEFQMNIIDNSQKSLDPQPKRKWSDEQAKESYQPEKREKIGMHPSNGNEDGSVGAGRTLDLNSHEYEQNNSAITDWVQKASWKSLVGETGRLSFSLSSVLGQSKLPTPDYDAKQNNGLPSEGIKSSINGFSILPSHTSSVNNTDKTCNESNSVPIGHRTNKYQENRKSHEKFLPTHENSDETRNKVPQQKNSSFVSLVASNVCPFMKSENSEKEWLESRKAVKEIFKRYHKDATRKMKILHTKVKC